MMVSTFTRPNSTQKKLAGSQSMSQQNFKIFKSYIKKGLVDILDREGGRNSKKEHAALSDEEDKSFTGHLHLRQGQRPSDMQSFQ